MTVFQIKLEMSKVIIKINKLQLFIHNYIINLLYFNN